MSLRARAERKDEVITTRLETDLVERLRVLAREHERTIAAEVRLAVRRYLDEVSPA